MKKAAPLHILMASAFFILSFIGKQTQAQESNWKQFCKLSCPEKRWVIFHPFIAKKALSISKEARKMSNSVVNDRSLDGDENGGQVDAFRHCFWMARLAQEIHWRKAKKLGIAHEKGNKRNFKKRKLEEGTLPDAISCEMDLLNNKAGINMGKSYPEIDSEGLSILIKQEITTGNLWIIRKNRTGGFLDCNNKLIPKNDYMGKWENSKCLVSSNFQRPQ